MKKKIKNKSLNVVGIYKYLKKSKINTYSEKIHIFLEKKRRQQKSRKLHTKLEIK